MTTLTSTPDRRSRRREVKGYAVVPYPILKQTTDKLVALTLLVLLSPLLLVILLGIGVGMVVRSADRGPLLYRERRISRGKEIEVLKFRVLREGVLARMRRDGNGHTRLYEADVENLTWAGRYLIKKWYLDEVPQLLNILKGDMSLVGPRPWPLEMVRDQLERGLDYRNLIVAGWTGPAQSQKTDISLRGSEALDLEYVTACRTMSGWRLCRYDFRILLKTLKLLVRGQGLRF